MRRGAPSAPALKMTARQKQLLQQLSRDYSTPQQIAQRAQLLVLASEGISNSQIKRELDVAYNTVLNWRRRWKQAQESLLDFEQGPAGKGVNDLTLKRRLSTLLGDQPRSGAPKTFTMAQRQQIVALACEEPADHGLEMTDWTHEMLAKVAVAKGIVQSISPSHLGKILKKQSATTA